MSHRAERLQLTERHREPRARHGVGESATDLAQSYAAADFFVVRSPLLPLAQVLDWCAEAEPAPLADLDERWAARRAALGASLRATFERPALRRALYFASPDLEEFCRLSAELTPHLTRTLTRYFMRAAGRETPFGLFAGVSLARIADRDRFELAPASANRSVTSLSACYLQHALTELGSAPPARDAFRHTLVPSLVRLAERYRFTTNVPSGVVEEHRATCTTLDLAATPQVDRAIALAAPGLTPEELARQIATGVIGYADALTFAGTLCERGLLVLDLLPSATGYDALGALHRLARQPATSEPARALISVAQELTEADAGCCELGAGPFRTAAEKLNPIVLPTKGQLPLQSVLLKAAPKLSMSEDVARLFLDAARLIQRTSRREDKSALAEFRGRFQERYGTATVPLAQALDTEFGVEFADPRDSDPLLKDLRLSRAPTLAEPFDEFDRVRQKIVHRALRSGVIAFELDDEVLAEFPSSPEPDHEAESFVVLARLARERDGKLTVIAPGVIPSALKTLARFCHAEPALSDVLRQLAAREQALAGDALLADVAYLPAGTAANIVTRPVLRDYEVPYLGGSGAPAAGQIPISDLYVQVRNERVILYSRQQRKQVKIRISNALNQKHGAHPVLHRFLAAVQAQDEASLTSAWSWGALASSQFLPRIVRGHTVLSLARWQFSASDLESALSTDGAAAFRAVQRLRERYSLPRLLSRSFGDQLLPIDLDNELSVEELLHEARQNRSLAVQELLPRPEQMVVQGPEGGYCAEFVVPFLRLRPQLEAQSRLSASIFDGSHADRHHAPGSSWLYAKVYAAPSRMDALLKRVQSDVLSPLRSGVESWFFLPFADPHPHLRLRFRGAPNFLHEALLPALQRSFEAEQRAGAAWRLQIDTYEPEQERYGGKLGVELAERVFDADSDACGELIAISRFGSDFRWQIALLGIDRLLGDFGFDIVQRRELARATSQSYGAEAGADRETWQAIAAQYRARTARLSELLWLTPKRAQGAERRVLRILARRSQRLEPIWRDIERARQRLELDATVSDLARSFTHMHAVRLLGVRARSYELVLFDSLQRLYTSHLARAAEATPAPTVTRTSEQRRAKA